MTAVAAGTVPSAHHRELFPALVSELLDQHGEARIRVAGTSMLPSIRPGDTLTVRRIEITSVQRDDVVVVAVGDRLFAHRVVRVEGPESARRLITKGDRHSLEDPAVTPAELLGRVEGQLRSGRDISYRWCIACRRLLRWSTKPLRRTAHDSIDVGER